MSKVMKAHLGGHKRVVDLQLQFIHLADAFTPMRRTNAFDQFI